MTFVLESPTTGEEVKVLKVPPSTMIAVMHTALERSGIISSDWASLEQGDKVLMVKSFVFNCLDLLVGKGFVQITPEQFGLWSAKVLSHIMGNMGADLAEAVQKDKVLLLRNVILNSETGMFPKVIEDKMVLWAFIFDHSDLSAYLDADPIGHVVNSMVEA